MAAPEKLTIETPEQIALEFTIATLGSRFLALAIDTLFQLAAVVALLVGLTALRLIVGPFSTVLGSSVDAGGIWLQAALVLVFFLIYYGYFVFFELRWAGQTPGKRLVGLRAIHVSGRPMSGYETILRNLVRVVDQLPGIYAVGILSVFLTERSQRLGDLAAETVVVHERPVEGQLTLGPQGAASVRYGAARLSPEEFALVETFLRRRDELSGVRELRARQIAERIRQRLGVDATADDERFLEEVAAEFRRSYR